MLKEFIFTFMSIDMLEIMILYFQCINPMKDISLQILLEWNKFKHLFE